MAVEFGQTGLEGGVAEGDGEEEDAPESLDGIVVASTAAGPTQTLQEGCVGQGLEKFGEGGEVGMVVEPGPGKQGIGDVQLHGARIERKAYPVERVSGVKFRKNGFAAT
jgi:hypothetical protein